MGKYTQDNRPLAISTPLGKDALLLEKLAGTEAISEPFRFQLDLLAETPIDFNRLLGQPATVRVAPANGTARWMNGIVWRLRRDRRVPAAEGGITLIRYHAELVPAFSLLTRRVRCRVFQGRTVPQILQQILQDDWRLDVRLDLKADYPTRNYCVQYQESDFAFVSRLMEAEGICYAFVHRDGGHQLRLSDGVSGALELPAPAEVVYREEPGRTPGPRLWDWQTTQELCACRAAVRDYSFQAPRDGLESVQDIRAAVAFGDPWSAQPASYRLGHLSSTNQPQLAEIFDYPGGHAWLFDDINKEGQERKAELDKLHQANQRLARLRIEREASGALAVQGSGDYGNFAPGYRFRLENRDGPEWSFQLTRVEHRAALEGVYTPAPRQTATYENHFNALPAAMPFRPKPTTPLPRIDGVQTAVVIGPGGQDLFTDAYGRVKVQFFWDRQGANRLTGQDGQPLPQMDYWPGPPANTTPTCSCWVRVAQGLAGSGYGQLNIPRVGHEVLIAFEGGDPDRPYIVGSLYNNLNKPALTLPDAADHVGITTHSLGGQNDQASGLTIRDQPGREVVHLHSQRDLVLSAEGHQIYHIAGDVYHDVRGRNIQVCGSLPGLGGSGGGGAAAPVDPSKVNPTDTESPVGKTGNLNSGDLYLKGYFDGMPQTFGLTTGFTYGLDLKGSVGFSSSIGMGGKLSIALDPLSMGHPLLGSLLVGAAVGGMGVAAKWSALGTQALVPALGAATSVLSGAVGISFSKKIDVTTNEALGVNFGEKTDWLPSGIEGTYLKKFAMLYNIVGCLELLAYGTYAYYARQHELQRVKEMAAKGQKEKVAWDQPLGETVALGVGGGLLGLGAVVILISAAVLLKKKKTAEATLKAAKNAAGAKNLEVGQGLAADRIAALKLEGKTKYELFEGHYAAQYDSFNTVGKEGVDLRTNFDQIGGDCSLNMNPIPLLGGITLQVDDPVQKPTIKLASDNTSGITLQAGLPMNEASINISAAGIVLKCGLSQLKIGPRSITLECGAITALTMAPGKIELHVGGMNSLALQTAGVAMNGRQIEVAAKLGPVQITGIPPGVQIN